MMSRSSSSSRIIKNNNLFHLLKSFKEFGGAIIVLIRDGALQLSSRPQQRISLYSCLFLGGSSECESMCNICLDPWVRYLSQHLTRTLSLRGGRRHRLHNVDLAMQILQQVRHIHLGVVLRGRPLGRQRTCRWSDRDRDRDRDS